VIYTRAKTAMMAAVEVAIISHEWLSVLRAVVEADGVERPAQVAAFSKAVVEADAALAAAVTIWREELLTLHRAALSLGGGPLLAVVGKPTTRLIAAARGYVEAKADIDSHAGPFNGITYSALIASWRGAMKDLDAAAKAYAGSVDLAAALTTPDSEA
jgi:hypothetical protein